MQVEKNIVDFLDTKNDIANIEVKKQKKGNVILAILFSFIATTFILMTFIMFIRFPIEVFEETYYTISYFSDEALSKMIIYQVLPSALGKLTACLLFLLISILLTKKCLNYLKRILKGLNSFYLFLMMIFFASVMILFFINLIKIIFQLFQLIFFNLSNNNF